MTIDNALVFGGGGYKGVFPYGWMRNHDIDKFTVAFGTSVGALNAMIWASEDREKGYKVWEQVIHSGTLFHSANTLNYLAIGGAGLNSLFGTPFDTNIGLGFYTNKLASRIDGILAETKLVRPFYVTTVDDLSNQIFYINIQQVGRSEYMAQVFNKKMRPLMTIHCDRYLISQLITASTSIPVIFPPVVINLYSNPHIQHIEYHSAEYHYVNTLYLVDGGVVDIAPLNGPIQLGITNITIVSCSPLNGKKQYDFRPTNIIAMLSRNLDIMTGEILDNDIAVMQSYNEIIKYMIDNGGTLPDKKYINYTIVAPSNPFMLNSIKPTKPELINGYVMGSQA